MKLPTLLTTIVEALRSAGAAVIISSVAVKASGELRTPHPGGRPRKHTNGAERAREYRKRKKRHKTSLEAAPCLLVKPPRVTARFQRRTQARGLAGKSR
jgi:hypothetical protein